MMGGAPKYRCAHRRPSKKKGGASIARCAAEVEGLAVFCKKHAHSDETAYLHGPVTRELPKVAALFFALPPVAQTPEP